MDPSKDPAAGESGAEAGAAPKGGLSGTGLSEAGWASLRTAAREAMARAYAPYSGYPVGAAALVDDGRTVSGCNVENASFGLGLCAECGLVSRLQATGGGRLTHFACVDGRGEPLVPCGRCRQLLYEFGGPELVLETPAGFCTLAEMLPQAFGPDHLVSGHPAQGGPVDGPVDGPAADRPASDDHPASPAS